MAVTVTDWKMRMLLDQLNDTCAIFYISSEHLALDEVNVFKDRVTFKQYNPKKHKCFGIKIYKLCNTTDYTYSMNVYLGKDKAKCNTDDSDT
jgi:hypothetical protein